MAYEWPALAHQVGCTMITGELVGIDDPLWLAGINFDKIIAAILPCRFFCAAGLGRTWIIHPAIKLVGFMHMAQG